jgi:hypothetical protein
MLFANLLWHFSRVASVVKGFGAFGTEEEPTMGLCGTPANVDGAR